jgi:hypothetical protein
MMFGQLARDHTHKSSLSVVIGRMCHDQYSYDEVLGVVLDIITQNLDEEMNSEQKDICLAEEERKQ